MIRGRSLNPHNKVASFQPLLVQASTKNMTQPKNSKNEAKPTLLYLVTEDWYFCSHRLTLACKARNKGYDIVVATRVNNHKEQIEKEGFKLIPIPFIRRSKNILRELSSLLNIVRIYKKVRPDIVHNIGIKPVLYGTWATKFIKTPIVINLLAGLTEKFHENEWKSSVIRKMVNLAYRLGYLGVNAFTVFQNSTDMNNFLKQGIVEKENVELIRGSGVDTKKFDFSPEPEGIPIVVLASRLIWEKGVGEFVEASKILQGQGIKCRMVLVGDCDPDSTGSVPGEQLDKWLSEGAIEWWGHKDDMAEVFSNSHIACLPSYHEGTPRVLLEAAACGRAIVTTDVPGCRQIVKDNEGGLIVPIKNSKALAESIRTLVDNPDLRVKMGKRGREIILTEFSDDIIIGQTLALYERLLLDAGLHSEPSTVDLNNKIESHSNC